MTFETDGRPPKVLLRGLRVAGYIVAVSSRRGKCGTENGGMDAGGCGACRG